MNLANYYAEREYGAGAIARFADSLAQVNAQAVAQRVFRVRPLLSKPLQKAVWKVLEEAKKPLRSIQVCNALPQKYHDERGKSMARAILGSWTLSGWLVRTGTVRTHTYRIKEQA